MKKIMFNDKFGLTEAVLSGRKTMTRRFIKGDFVNVREFYTLRNRYFAADTKEGRVVEVKPAFEIGEEIAIAQRYKDICLTDPIFFEGMRREAGWNNKMFAKAEYMPHRIRITDIKAERLQDISEEDAMQEGVFKYDKPPLHHEADMFAPWPPYVRPYKWDSNNLIYRCTARYAFAALIDRISGRGTWNTNPWVYAYTFELVR